MYGIASSAGEAMWCRTSSQLCCQLAAAEVQTLVHRAVVTYQKALCVVEESHSSIHCSSRLINTQVNASQTWSPAAALLVLLYICPR